MCNCNCISKNGNTELLDHYKRAINHNCLRLHMTYYSTNYIVLFTVVSSFLCFHEVMLLIYILYLALEPLIVHFTGHIILRAYALCDCMRRFTSSCVVLEVQQCIYAIFIVKSSLSSNYVGNSPCAQ